MIAHAPLRIRNPGGPEEPVADCIPPDDGVACLIFQPGQDVGIALVVDEVSEEISIAARNLPPVRRLRNASRKYAGSRFCLNEVRSCKGRDGKTAADRPECFSLIRTRLGPREDTARRILCRWPLCGPCRFRRGPRDATGPIRCPRRIRFPARSDCRECRSKFARPVDRYNFRRRARMFICRLTIVCTTDGLLPNVSRVHSSAIFSALRFGFQASRPNP